MTPEQMAADHLHAQEYGLSQFMVMVERRQRVLVKVYAESSTHANKVAKILTQDGSYDNESWEVDQSYCKIIHTQEIGKP